MKFEREGYRIFFWIKQNGRMHPRGGEDSSLDLEAKLKQCYRNLLSKTLYPRMEISTRNLLETLLEFWRGFYQPDQ